MELVPAKLTPIGPEEARPHRNNRFSILYGNDGLGDSSVMTGFFVFTKQGSLQRKTEKFDGVLPNQIYEIDVDNINNTDIWLNNINPDTGDTIDDGSSTTHASGEWQEVDLANAQNIIFNTNPIRTKYEIETLENDRVRVVFGDGDFSDIPSGTFDIWYRVSSPTEIFIPQNSVVDKRTSFKYIDANGRIQTITITYSLTSALYNNSPSEDIEHIRKTAPSVYYAQDRMVNGRDYNSFPLRESSILKLRTINRTFAGDTAYLSANDPSFTYQDVKIFGNDLSIFYKPSTHSITAPGSVTANVLLINYIQPLLSTVDVYLKIVLDTEAQYVREFTSDERNQIINVFQDVNYPWPVTLAFFDTHDINGNFILTPTWQAFSGIITNPNIRVSMYVELSNDSTTYSITYQGKRIVVDSPSTRFYYDNNGQRVLTFNNLNSLTDNISILKANYSSTFNKLLTDNINMQVIQIERYENGLLNAGLPNYNQVSVITYDTNGDLIPDNIHLPELLNSNQQALLDEDASFISGQYIETPRYVVGLNDVVVDLPNSMWSEDGFSIIAMNCQSGPNPDQIQAIPTFPDNTFFINDNLTSSISVGSVIKFTSPFSQHNKLYRIGQVVYTGSYTAVTIVQDINIADPTGEYLGLMSTTIDAPSLSNQGGIISIIGTIGNGVYVFDNNTQQIANIEITQYVYFNRESITEQFIVIPDSPQNMVLWYNDDNQLFNRLLGKSDLNFLWQHRSSQLNLIDPSPTNIHDMFIITRSYYTQFNRWLSDEIPTKPVVPTPSELRNSYNKLLDNKMLSDTVIMHPGKIKVIIGSKANPELRAKIKVIRTSNTNLTDNQIKIRIVNIVRDFFNISDWDYGHTFYYTELDTKIQSELPSYIASTVLVPTLSGTLFGDLYQIVSAEDEIIQGHITVDDIEIIQSYNATNIKQLN